MRSADRGADQHIPSGTEAVASIKVRIYGCNLYLLPLSIDGLANRGGPSMTSARSRAQSLAHALPAARPRVRWRFHPFQGGPQSGSHRELRTPSGQISPNKNMSLQCTTAAFTLPPDTSGFVILCSLAPGLSLLCDFCSSARTFAFRLPSDKSSRPCPCLRLVVILIP